MSQGSDMPPVTALVFMKLESERVPRKNLRMVGGQPLFHWILAALQRSRHIGRVVLNTDSELIADAVTARFNVTIHMRPDHLLHITSDEANQIMAWDLANTEGEYFIQTHSTNPFLTSATLDRAVEAFFEQALPAGYDSLLSVTSHQKRFFFVGGQPVNHDPGALKKTQQLEPLLEENSCVYVFSRSSFAANRNNRIGRKPFLYSIPAGEALDIDTEGDLRLADRLMMALGTDD